MAVFKGAGFGLLCREGQHISAQAGRGIGHGQADDVGFARVGKAVVDLNGAVDFLPGLVKGDQLGRGFDLGVLDTLERWVQTDAQGRLRQPDLTLWFDVPPAVAAQRLAAVRTPDRFEAEPLAFFERVRAGYAARASAAPERIVRIDATRPLPQVWAEVESVCRARGVLA